MKLDPNLLSTAAEIIELVKVLEQHEVIAFDTEFIRESTFFPIVEIIQVATETESWLVDAQAFKKNFRTGDPHSYDPAIQPLLDIFTNPKILKIVHAAQGDQECLYTSFGVVAKPSLDTAVAASLCGYGDGVGLGKLLKGVLNITLDKGHSRTNWFARPLPDQLVEYAHADVKFLVELGKQLLAQLEPLGRKNWGLELSGRWENVALYQADVEGITQKLARGGRLDKKAYPILRDLVKWREDRVRQLNLPRRWLADDHVLINLAQVRPKDLGHLSTFRGLNKGELKQSGEAILAILRRVVDPSEIPAQKSTAPREPKILPPTQEETQVLDLMRCYLGILADQHKIAAKHLMTTDKLLSLVRHEIATPADLVSLDILSPEAAQLIGAEFIAMVQGKRALLMKGCRIEVLNL